MDLSGLQSVTIHLGALSSRQAWDWYCAGWCSGVRTAEGPGPRLLCAHRRWRSGDTECREADGDTKRQLTGKAGAITVVAGALARNSLSRTAEFTRSSVVAPPDWQGQEVACRAGRAGIGRGPYIAPGPGNSTDRCLWLQRSPRQTSPLTARRRRKPPAASPRRPADG